MNVSKKVLGKSNSWLVCRPDLVMSPHKMEADVSTGRNGYSYLPFRRSNYLSTLDDLESRGMYREELSIERGKFPSYNRVLGIHTNGSLSDYEVEYSCPSFVVLFQDGFSVYKSTKSAQLKLERKSPLPKLFDDSRDMGSPTVRLSYFPYVIPSSSCN